LKTHAILALAAGVCLGAIGAQADDGPAGQSLSGIVKTCEGCHGPGGDSRSADIPRLNGQQADYLASRFVSFSDPTRQTAHASSNMWPMTSQVADKIIPDLAKYFAARLPTPSRPSGPLAAEGKSVYQNGAANVASCQSCHGALGEGKGAVPRLAGQHGGYLKAQLTGLYYQVRVSGAMHPSIKYLSPQQIDALTAYLENG